MSDDVRLAVAITHAPWNAQRRAWVVDQRRRLAPLPVTVVADHDHSGCWVTTRKAWKRLLLDGGATHLLVLCDDLMPCEDFAAHAATVVGLVPYAPVVLYTGRRTLASQVRERGGHWGISRGFAWGGATVLPRDVALGFVRWCERPEVRAVLDRENLYDDSRIMVYLTGQGLETYIVLPSLLEDLGGKQSLIGHNAALGHEVAWFKDGVEVEDWSMGLDRPVRSAPGTGKPTTRAMLSLGVTP